MSASDWQLSRGLPLCAVADSFYRTVRETIFQQLTPETTASQWQQAMACLTRLRDELQHTLYPMHYGALVGTHRCLEQVFTEAVARLRNLEIMQPQPDVPEPSPVQAPEPAPRSVEDVAGDFLLESEKE